MPSKSALTPAEVEAQLAEAEAAHRRLADKAAAIRQAGEDTRRAVELSELHRAYRELPDPARAAAIAARKELDEISTAEVLNLDALVAAFDKRQRADAEIGALGLFLANLNVIDPLPPGPNGVSQTRNARIARRFAGMKFSDYLDNLISRREQATHNNRSLELQTQLEETIDAAEDTACTQAAQLADGERYEIDTPATIADKYHEAIAKITPDMIEQRAAENHIDGITARNLLRRDMLRLLLHDETSGPELAAAPDAD